MAFGNLASAIANKRNGAGGVTANTIFGGTKPVTTANPFSVSPVAPAPKPKPTPPASPPRPKSTPLTSVDTGDAERMAQLEAERDAMVEAYFSAANTSLSKVNSMVDSERAIAAVQGVQYGLTDAIKEKRIADAFADTWSEEQQAKLEGAIAGAGANGFEQTIFRGITGSTEAPLAGALGQKTGSRGVAPKGRALALGGMDSILGA